MKIRGKEYSIEKKGDTYWLTGKRGAEYYTERNVPDPTKMFIIPKNFMKGFGTLSGVWLTDVNGRLEIIKQ